MANYDIPQYPSKRLRYFNNQFLKDQDFIDDTSHQIGCERALLRSLCVAGVCEGLVVSYPATNQPPSVSAGVAIDGSGQMIVLDQLTAGRASPAALADGDYFVHISFLESEDDKATGQGAPDYTRWKQTPVITATAKTAALPAGAVVLGSCTVRTGLFVGSGTTSGRQYSGLRLPGANQGTTATLRNTGASDDLAVLGGSLTVRRDAGGQLGPTLTLLNGAGAAGAGGAIDFNGSDPGSNDPSLRLRSLDDGNASSHLTFATRQSGAVTNHLVERLRLTSDGLLQFASDGPRDKLVLSDDGAGNRYGMGLNDANLNLFCPAGARFSLRQDSTSGTEVFSVSGSGAVAFAGPLGGSLTIRNDVAGQLGPALTLLNGGGAAGAGGAIDFNGSDPGVNAPSLRLQSLGDGNFSSHLMLATKQPGAVTNNLVERLRLTSDGVLQFPNDVPKDKIIIWGAASANRFGLGLNSGNINLFCPAGNYFSLRQNSSSGTEFFSVNSNGTATFKGAIVPKVGNDGSSGIYFPTNPGGGGGDEAFLRYYVTSGEATKLMLGINNDYNDELGLWQQGGERITLSSGYIYMNSNTYFRGSYGSASDLELKQSIRPLDGILAGVMQLRPVRFAWKSDSTEDLGFIAQEVEAVFPEAVFTVTDEEVPDRPVKALSAHHVAALALAALRELKQQVDGRLDAVELALATPGQQPPGGNP